MKYKIGIFGSPAETGQAVIKAERLGLALADLAEKAVVITGACSGIPYIVASKAAEGGVEIWGFSPMFDLAGQKENWPDDDSSIYSRLIYVSRDFEFSSSKRARMKLRNVSSTASCDAGIIISGKWGSLNEFTNLLDMQKIVGVLTGTGGIADELGDLSKKITKEGQGTIIFDDSPEHLISKIIDALGGRSE